MELLMLLLLPLEFLLLLLLLPLFLFLLLCMLLLFNRSAHSAFSMVFGASLGGLGASWGAFCRSVGVFGESLVSLESWWVLGSLGI